MKEFEKYSIASLGGAVLSYNLSLNIAVSIVVFSISIGCGIYIKKYRYLIMVGLIILIASLITWDKELEKGELYKISMKIDRKIEIKNIDNKIPREKYYLKNNYLENRIGSFSGKIRVKNIEKYNDIYYIDGEIIELKESYFNKGRNFIRKIIENIGYSHELEAFTKAIVLGEKNDLSLELEDRYRTVGASHLLAISGLHIGIIVLIFLKIFHYFSFSYKMKYSLTILVLSAYVLILGNNPSVIRAYIMGIVYLLSKLMFEKTSLKKSFCISSIIALLFNPNVIGNLSFIMSYSALFGIIYIYELFKKDKDYLNLLILSIVIQIVLLPTSIYFFKTLPIYTFLFNIFIVFWGSILINVIFINVFLGSLKIGFLFRFIVEIMYDILDVFIKTIEKFKFYSIELDKKVPFYFFIMLIVLIVFLMKKSKYFSYLGMILIMVYTFLPFENVIENNFYYFPKEKTIVLTGDKSDRIMEKYVRKAKIFVKSDKNRLSFPVKEIYEMKKGEEIKIGKLTIRNDGEIGWIYD